MKHKEPKEGDLNGDGIIDEWDQVTAIINAIITIVAIIAFIVLVIIGIVYSPT